MKLQDKLYSLRKKNGYTQAELAEMLGVSRQSISNWELGTIQPSTSRLKKLSELYSMPLETLLDDGLEIQLQSEQPLIEVHETRLVDESTEISKCFPAEIDQKKNRIRKAVIAVIGVILACVVGIFIYCYVTTGNTGNEHISLDQLGNEEVTVSSGNGFDLQ